MANSDPWAQIAAPAGGQVAGIRVDDKLNWNFFWAVDQDGSLMLTLRFAADSLPEADLPRPKGLEIGITPVGGADDQLLMIKLVDRSNREIFHRLCSDIIDATRNAPDERQAVSLAIRRTWRWHYLLRSGANHKLSMEEQKGLIGEIIVLRDYVLRLLPAVDAVRSWMGPEDAPKDFEIGRLAVEAKARRGAAKPHVAISSEDQLDDSGVELLFLHVVDLALTPMGSGGFTITELADEVLAMLLPSDVVATDLFEDKLQKVGLRLEDSYESDCWLIGSTRVFAVTDGFPRITAGDTPPGVESVSYSIDLGHIVDFEVGEGDLEAAIQEAISGN